MLQYRDRYGLHYSERIGRQLTLPGYGKGMELLSHTVQCGL